MRVIRVIMPDGDVQDVSVERIPYDYRVAICKAPNWREIFSGKIPEGPICEVLILNYDVQLSLSAGIPTYI